MRLKRIFFFALSCHWEKKQYIFSVSNLQSYLIIPLHVSGVERADAISQRFVRVGGDLLELVRLHLLKQTRQVLLPGLQLSPLERRR